MSTLKNRLVDILGTVPEQVGPNTYRNGDSFWLVSPCGVTVKNATRNANQLKMSWDDPIEAFLWVDAVLDAPSPAANKLARVIPALIKQGDFEIASVMHAPEPGIVTSSLWTNSGFGVAITWSEGYYDLFDYATGDEYRAGTVDGVVRRCEWISIQTSAYELETLKKEKGGV